MTELMREPMTTPNLGIAAAEDRDRVDFRALRAARRARVFTMMDELGLDALLLGREANVKYTSGARRLWTASSRPYGPTCVAVRATGRVHLMTFSASYEGTPEEVPFEDVYCNSFNPAKLLDALRAAPGLDAATRIGVDGFSMFMRQFLPAALPRATFIGVEPQLRALRRHKLDQELVVLRTAIAIAESALFAAASEVHPGVSEKHVQACFLDRMCQLGTSQFAQQGTFTVIEPGGGLRWITSHRGLGDGELVALGGGVLWAGYEGSLARTWWCSDRRRPADPHRELYRRWRTTIDRVIDACRPGRNGADLVAAHEKAGEALPAMPIAYALGLGHEGSIAGSSLGAAFDRQQLLHAGMVVAVRTFIPGAAGGFFGEEMVLVRHDDPEVLTTLGHGPLASPG